MAQTALSFVTIRPPTATSATEVVRPEPDDFETLDKLVDDLDHAKDAKERVWRELARRIRTGGPHFRLHASGGLLAEASDEAHALLASAATLDYGVFRQRAGELLAPMSGGRDDLEEAAKVLRSALLFAHWAWVLDPAPAPQDGRLTKPWLIMLSLAHESESSWLRQRGRLNRYRVGFPSYLLRLGVRLPPKVSDGLKDAPPGTADVSSESAVARSVRLVGTTFLRIPR